MNTRNKLYYKRQKLDDECEKDVVTKDIISFTSVVDKIRKEIKLWDGGGDNARKMNEQVKKMDEREQGKVKEMKIRDKNR